MVPDGASCWICLDEGLDESGKPILRDCSCRGQSGFAHLSCIIEYAQHKSKHAVDAQLPQVSDFHKHWQTCPNCNQRYQHELRLDLSTAFVSFAETMYGYPGNKYLDQLRIMVALRLKTETISHVANLEDKPNLMEEGEMAVNKMFNMIEQIKKGYGRWVHMPPTSKEYQAYKVVRVEYESCGLIHIAGYSSLKRTEEGDKRAISYLEKAKAIYNLFGLEKDARGIEKDIACIKSNINPRGDGDAMAYLKASRDAYENQIQRNGKNSHQTMLTGLRFATALANAKCGIEAERHVTKLAATIRQVHGPEHNMSQRAAYILEQVKARHLAMKYQSNLFQALRYVDNGECCVVKGPITKPRNTNDEETFTVASDLVLPAEGCPVICHGLQNASHLNGKIGDVRDFLVQKSGGCRFAVHFENERLKPALVKPENLRIVFDLPDEE